MASKLGSLSSRSAMAIISLVFTRAITLNINAQAQISDFDFFYLVLQWPGSYCDTENGCCYPRAGKPAANFSIHGLWPQFNDGTHPSNCDPSNSFDLSQLTDLVGKLNVEWESLACPSNNGHLFWRHEWDKHGTCSETTLNQHDYFQEALLLRDSVDPLGALANAGINPDDNQYSLDSISEALATGIGYTPGIECNRDTFGNRQLYQIYLCVDNSGTNFIDCSVLPENQCTSQIINFPSF